MTHIAFEIFIGQRGTPVVNYFIFLAASSIEYFGTFMFMFALFRFRIHPQLILNVFFVAFIMSQVSYFTRLNPEIGDLSTFIQLPLFVLVFWILFLIPLFHSIIMNFAGVAGIFVVQGLSLLTITQVGGISMDALLGNIWSASALQVLSAILLLAIARTIVIMNWGFDFVPTSPRSNVRIKGTNAILIGIISFVVVVAALIAFLFRSNLDIYVICASVVFIVSLPFFIYFAVKKDIEDAA